MHQPGTNIKALRSQMNLKQKDLAKITGLDQATISNIERGALGYSQDSIDKIAKALNVTPGVLFADGDSVDAAMIGARRVPVLDEKDVAGWRGIEEATFDWDSQRFLFTELKTASRFAFALEIKTTQNTPLLGPGDMVIFDLDLQPSPAAFVVATDDKGHVYIGRFRQLSNAGSADQPFEVVPADTFHAPVSSLSSTGLKLKGVLVEHRKYSRPIKI